LRQKEFFSTVKLGAVGNDLAALANFFTPGGLQPVDGLSEAYKAFVLGQVAFRFMLLGRCQEAIQAFHVTLGVVPPESDLKNAAILATNLSELYLITGDLPQALNYARQSYEWSERDGNPYQQMHSKARIADIEHQKGNLAEAEDTFREAEEMQKGIEPNAPILYSRSGFQYCNLLLSTGEYDEVEARAKVMLQIAEKNRWLIEIAHGHLLLGEARLLRSKDAGGDALARATDHLNRAVNGLRTSGTFYDLPRGLLARAGLQRVKGDFESAQTDLAQALDLVERGGMKLSWADCHLEYARLCLARGEEVAAGEHLKSAKELIERTGYNVRAAAVKEIEEQYGGAGS
jgi:tetratricopeptide (TPR) repeat protein